MVRSILAACEVGEEGLRGVFGGCGGGRGGGCRVLPLLGDGDAVFEIAEGLRAPEGEEIVLDHWLVADDWVGTAGERGVVEQQVLEVGEVGKGGGDDAGERVVAEIECCEICELQSLGVWSHSAR